MASQQTNLRAARCSWNSASFDQPLRPIPAHWPALLWLLWCEIVRWEGFGSEREPFDVEALLSSPKQFSNSPKVESSFLSSVHQIVFWDGLRMRHTALDFLPKLDSAAQAYAKNMKQPSSTDRSWYVPLNVFR